MVSVPAFKDLSELTLMDDYMFGVVMRDPKLITPLIERILDTRIRSVQFVEAQRSVKEGYDAKGVRLDLFVEDESGSLNNVEVQTSNKHNLPKRMRYYQSIIDLHVLNPGANYSELKKSYIIFICNYDPFGRNRALYTFENRCLEDLDLPFGDETQKVIVNIGGLTEGATTTFKELVDYLEDGTVSGDYSKDLDSAVRSIKSSEERRMEYMVMMAREMEIRAEGRAEGERSLAALIAALLQADRGKDVPKALSDEVFRKKLYAEFGIS